MRMSSGLTDNGQPGLQPVLFPVESILCHGGGVGGMGVVVEGEMGWDGSLLPAPSGGGRQKRRDFLGLTRGSLAMCGGARQPRANFRCPFRASQLARVRELVNEWVEEWRAMGQSFFDELPCLCPPSQRIFFTPLPNPLPAQSRGEGTRGRGSVAASLVASVCPFVGRDENEYAYRTKTQFGEGGGQAAD